MSELNIIPFERGTTLGGGATVALADGVQYEGMTKEIYDDTYKQKVTLMCVRNVATVALQPKRLVRFKAGMEGRQVDGYTAVAREQGFPVDEKLIGTVAVNDLFFIVVDGPALIRSDMASLTTFVAGAPVHAQTAANSTAAGTTGVGGRIDAVPLTGNTATQAMDFAMNLIGRAITGRTTNNTDTDTLIRVSSRY